MKPSIAKHAIKTAILAGEPVFLWGPPGVGKSSIVAQVSKELNKKLYDVRTTLLEPVDLRGLPSISGDTTRWSRPCFLPTESESILFLDELPNAEQSVQAACYQPVHDKRIGEHELPADMAIIAAGNRTEDRCGTNRMPMALANRFVHIDIEVDKDDWCRWALASNVRTEVVAFIFFQPDKLLMFDPKKDTRAFASPRSWEKVSHLLDSKDKQDDMAKNGKGDGLPADVIESMIIGTVGAGAGTEFNAFMLTYKDLPNPKQCLMNPKTAKLPSTPAGKYAICGSLQHHVDMTTVDNFFEYVCRMDQEFQTLAVKMATWKNDELCNSRSFIKWSMDNQGAFL